MKSKKKYPKITEQEREQLIIARVNYIDKHKQHALDLFKTYYKDKPLDNWKEWQKSSYDDKVKIVKFIGGKENTLFTQMAAQRHRFNVNKQIDYLIKLKHEQLVAYGVRNPLDYEGDNNETK